MNQKIARIGSIIVVITVALFALFMLVSDFGSYIVCIFLALGYENVTVCCTIENQRNADKSYPFPLIAHQAQVHHRTAAD